MKTNCFTKVLLAFMLSVLFVVCMIAGTGKFVFVDASAVVINYVAKVQVCSDEGLQASTHMTQDMLLSS